MSGEVLATIEDIDREIARLETERDRTRQLLQDPEQRKEREKLRERLTGLYVMDRIRQGYKNANGWLPIVAESAGEQSWVFDTDVLQADGYVSAPDGKGGTVWSRPGQS